MMAYLEAIFRCDKCGGILLPAVMGEGRWILRHVVNHCVFSEKTFERPVFDLRETKS